MRYNDLCRLALAAVVCGSFFASASFADLFGQPLSEQRDYVLLPGNIKIARIILRIPRETPHSTIAVCSDGVFDDVGNLRKIAKYFVPGEKYNIIDMSKLPEKFDHSVVKLVYYGSPVRKDEDVKDCLRRFPLLADLAKKATISSDETFKNLEESWKILHPLSVPLKTHPLCGSDGKVASRQPDKYVSNIRYTAKDACIDYYFNEFGFQATCVGDDCKIDTGSTEKVFKLISEMP